MAKGVLLKNAFEKLTMDHPIRLLVIVNNLDFAWSYNFVLGALKDLFVRDTRGFITGLIHLLVFR